MKRKQFARAAFSFLFLFCLIPGLGQPVLAQPQIPAKDRQPKPGRPVAVYARHYDLSPALRNMPPAKLKNRQARKEQPNYLLIEGKDRSIPASQPDQDASMQNAPGAIDALPDPILNFEGIYNTYQVAPPDTQGDIGYDPATGKKYYVQWVNLGFAVWDVTSGVPGEQKLVYGPVNGNTIFQGFGGDCETTNDGDPITLYDSIEHRWLMSQFALANYPSPPFYQCIAISQTADPTGAWYRYSFEWRNGAGMAVMNDYPKFGVWPDGYYMTANQFSTDGWAGTGVAAFEKDQMLAGGPARMIYFDLGVDDWGGMLPSDLDGQALPPAGAPNYFAEVHSDEWDPTYSRDELAIYEFHADWANTANSSFVPVQTLPLAPFNGNMCNFSRSCIPQNGTNAKLDAIADRTMYRLAYRNYNGIESLVSNLTVDSNGLDQAGIRWFQLKKEGDAWSLVQDSTFAPDSNNRWIGSIAQDHMGNIALGYSLSSKQMSPSIRYTGRLATDDPGTMQAEKSIFEGANSQTSTHSRWGDYSMMSIDPVDDCTFWYTNEYIGSNSAWRTRIASFKYSGCTIGPAGVLTGIVTSAIGEQPLQGAQITATSGSAVYKTNTNSSGTYRLDLPAGDYSIHVSAYHYTTESKNVVISVNQLRTLNFQLQPVNSYRVQGTVTDAQTGWPLYAHITLDGDPINPPPESNDFWTNPVTGEYQLTLSVGITYTFHIDAWTGGYLTGNPQVGPLTGDEVDNFSLTPDHAACSAPGYEPSLESCTPLAGSLVVGSASDQNTGAALPGVQVSDGSGYTTVTQPTIDPFVPDAFYVLFAPLGQDTLTASLPGYGSITHTLTVIETYPALVQDFSLPAGQLAYTPSPVEPTVETGSSLTMEVTIGNTGTLPVDFLVVENNSAYLSPESGLFAATGRHLGPKNLDKKSLAGVPYYLDPPANVAPINTGTLLSSIPTGLSMSWGIGLNTRTDDLWVSNPMDLTDYRFLRNGSATNDEIDVSALDAGWPADLAYDPIRRMLWQATVGGENCIYQLDPETRSATGKKICPPVGVSQRGLAFDPQTQTFYSGSWNDSIIYHFDMQGNMLDSANVNLAISGLAYNPSTGHIFVMTNWSNAYDVYVLDAKNNYSILGGFNIDGLGDFEQAGLELDCNGHLWAANQVQDTVLEADSGETGICTWADIPWLSVYPTSGMVPMGGLQKAVLTVDASNLQPGWYPAQLVVLNSTPYGSGTIPIHLTVAPLAHNLTLNASNLAGSAAPGGKITYPFILTNTGTMADTFDLFVYGNTWAASLSQRSITLGPGASAQLILTVAVPSPAPTAKSDIAQLTVVSKAKAALTGSLSFTTTVDYSLHLPLIVSSR